MQPHALVVSVALSVVAVAGAFLALLGIAALVMPRRVKAFLLGFAATPLRHYSELAVRIVVGLAFILASPQLPASVAFLVAGAVLAGTTSVMAVLPFRLHQAFARRSVPAALPYLPLIGLASLLAGLAVAWSVYAASVA
jgi:hypothetical protein